MGTDMAEAGSGANRCRPGCQSLPVGGPAARRPAGSCCRDEGTRDMAPRGPLGPRRQWTGAHRALFANEPAGGRCRGGGGGVMHMFQVYVAPSRFFFLPTPPPLANRGKRFEGAVGTGTITSKRGREIKHRWGGGGQKFVLRGIRTPWSAKRLRDKLSRGGPSVTDSYQCSAGRPPAVCPLDHCPCLHRRGSPSLAYVGCHQKTKLGVSACMPACLTDCLTACLTD